MDTEVKGYFNLSVLFSIFSVLEENYIYNLEDDGGTKKPELPGMYIEDFYHNTKNTIKFHL